MTKRWERELRRLDDVDAPTDRIRAHAADRPTDPSHGDGLPPRRQRITAGVVAVVVFVAAGTFAWQAFRPREEPPTIDGVDTDGALVVTLHAPVETQGDTAFPTATFTLGGQSTDIATQGINGWPAIPDDVGFDDPLYSLGFDVPAGTELVVEGDASSASATVRDDLATDTASFVDLDLSGGVGTLPSDAGQHVIELTGRWPEGTATFTAAFRIVPVAPADGAAAVLSFVGRNAPEGTLSFDGNDQSGTQSEYTWCDGSGGCVNGISDFTTYPPVSKFIEIPAGISLTLEGTVQSIKGGFRTLQGDKASPTIEDPSDLGTVPITPGRYALELHVALDGENNEHGSATFWFGVEVVDPAATAADPEISLAGTSWHVAEIDGVPLPDQMADASLVFSDTTVSGWTGCNRFETSFEVADTHLVTRGGSVTQVACDPSEADLLEVTFEDPSIQMDDSSLVLTGPDGKTVGLLAADAAPVDELRVSCQPNATQVLDSRVVAGPGGVMTRLPDAGHADKVRFEALQGQEMTGLEVPLQRHSSRYPISLEPGSWTLECMAPERGHESAVPIQVLDPGDLWASPAVACEGAHRVDVTLQPAALTFEGAVRQALDLRPGDVLRPPTYPRAATTLDLPVHLVVVRDGGTIAALDVWEERVQGDVCDDANLDGAG